MKKVLILSGAMIEQLRCVSKSRIGEILGRLSSDEMVKIEHGMRMMLGLEVVS
jgi:mRNA-degrading endonuclease toxin of MazEF toxin-antitoxin module